MFATQSPDARRIKMADMRMLADLAQYGNSLNCSNLRQYGKFPDFVISIT
jgi:hypothetical protein